MDDNPSLGHVPFPEIPSGNKGKLIVVMDKKDVKFEKRMGLKRNYES